MQLVSFNAHTCVGYQECFIPRATMAIVRWGIGSQQKAQPAVAGSGGDGGGGGGVAGVSQFS